MGGIGASVAALLKGRDYDGSLSHLSLDAHPVIALLATVAFAAPGVSEARVIEALGRGCELAIAAYGTPALIAASSTNLLASLSALKAKLSSEAGRADARSAAVAKGIEVVSALGFPTSPTPWDVLELKRAMGLLQGTLRAITASATAKLLATTTTTAIGSSSSPLPLNIPVLVDLLCTAAEITPQYHNSSSAAAAAGASGSSNPQTPGKHQPTQGSSKTPKTPISPVTSPGRSLQSVVGGGGVFGPIGAVTNLTPELSALCDALVAAKGDPEIPYSVLSALATRVRLVLFRGSSLRRCAHTKPTHTHTQLPPFFLHTHAHHLQLFILTLTPSQQQQQQQQHTGKP